MTVTKHDPLVAALVTAGLPADTARDLVDDGAAVTVAGHAMVIADETEEMTGRVRAVVAIGAEHAVADAAVLAALRAHVAAEHPGATSIVLRLPAGAEPHGAFPGRPLLRFVHAGPAVRGDLATDGWSIGPYRDDDRGDVAALLVTALRDGYAENGETAGEHEVLAFVDDVLDRAAAPDGDVTVFVARAGGVFAGHATVWFDDDELTGERRMELLDMFVSPAFRGTPASRLLVSAAVRWARERGYALRGHVVGHDDRAAAVHARLVGSGWTPDETYWVLP